MSLHVPHVPEPANAAANTFARLLDRDGYGPTAAMRMIAAIVDHARAVRLRCDARVHLTEMRRTMCTDRLHSGADEEHARLVHGLASHAATMTRRDLPQFRSPPDWRSALGRFDEVREATRDAGHDLLTALICDVDAEVARG